MRRSLLASLALSLALVLASAASASAAVFENTVDLSQIGYVNGATQTFAISDRIHSLTPAATLNSMISVQGFIYGIYGGVSPEDPNQGLYAPTPLWKSASATARGLGVCSEGTLACGLGEGLFGQINKSVTDEVLAVRAASRIYPASYPASYLSDSVSTVWTDIKISSLGPASRGMVYWSDQTILDFDPNPNLSNDGIYGFYLLDDLPHLSFASANVAADGSLFPYLIANGFDPKAPNLFFRADPAGPVSTTFLIGGLSFTDTVVPLPAALPLSLSALAWLGWFGRGKEGELGPKS